MNILINKIKEKRYLVSDGAWGTLLQRGGLAPGECPELWNDTHPDEVVAIARHYVEAGADIVETNSFGGSRIKLSRYALEDKASGLNEKAALLSRQAAGTRAIVAGSIGPTGKMLITGEVTPEQLYNAFREQAIALERGGADAACVETMSDLEEAQLAVRAVKENTRLEVICTFTFDLLGDGSYRTMMGATVEQVVSMLINEKVDVLGTNCGNGMEQMIPLLREIKIYAADIPLIVQANAGKPILAGDRTVFPDTPAVMAALVKDAVDAGASIIGGCCGTTPEHIRAIRNEVNIFRKARN
jgi:5-methyltetrahydrofolate--homocysteine methyltransferase